MVTDTTGNPRQWAEISSKTRYYCGNGYLSCSDENGTLSTVIPQ